MKKLLLVLGVIALASCEKSNDEIITPPDSQSPRLLTVEVSENPMHDENASAREMTRTAAATTTESLSGFTMHYTGAWSNSFTKTGSTWSTANWPVQDNTSIDFYAHDGGTFQWNSGNPYVSFTMEEDASKQKDFLVATHKQISYSQSGGGVVSLAFAHACAAVQFYVFQEESASYMVNSIILRNVCKQGDYYYNNTGATPKWQNVRTKTHYTLTTNVPENPFAVTTTPVRLPCGWLYLIPQTKDGTQEENGIQIEINYNSGKQKILNLSGSWDAGKQYTVNIRIGKAKTS